MSSSEYKKAATLIEAKSLDAARFGHTEPPFPAPESLLVVLQTGRHAGAAR